MPKTRIAGGMFLQLEGGETEPIGDRIIEVPEDAERTETLRDPRSGFIAYVPVGSIKKGEALVTTGGGKTTRAPCATARISKGSARCRASPADRRATQSGSSTTCSAARAKASGPI